ncbi:hypothetical protein HPB51_023551 [Rhipicephalus microplus]|uniref:Uncharacterized protein n=1 Tax=Rhipicephalus microplus TaxID=6941 RepID=A0A9J6DRG0_RHIMP|nr:hypothetical protein HPB51_023551 [Rhipicephalus microplus]
MAASAKTGYDPGTMQWVDIEVAETREDPIPGEDKYLQIMVRQLQEKLAKMKPRVSTAAAQPQARKSGSTLAACVESPRQLATWKPTNTPRIRTMNAGISVWPVWDQNIVVVGVKTESLASKLIGDITLTIGDHQVLFQGHFKSARETCKGVVTVADNETSQSLRSKLEWIDGEILYVRNLGAHNAAVVTFKGRRVPRFIHYCCENGPVCYYKKTIPACYRKFRKAWNPALRQRQLGLKNKQEEPSAPLMTDEKAKLMHNKPKPIKTPAGQKSRPPTFGAEDFPSLANPPKQIKDFVREEIARQLSLISGLPERSAPFSPTLRTIIRDRVSVVLPPQLVPPVNALLTYAEAAARPRPHPFQAPPPLPAPVYVVQPP